MSEESDPLLGEYDLLEDFDALLGPLPAHLSAQLPVPLPGKLPPPPFDFFLARREALGKVKDARLRATIETHYFNPEPFVVLILQLTSHKFYVMNHFPGMLWKKCPENGTKWTLDYKEMQKFQESTDQCFSVLLEGGRLFAYDDYLQLMEKSLYSRVFSPVDGLDFKFNDNTSAFGKEYFMQSVGLCTRFSYVRNRMPSPGPVQLPSFDLFEVKCKSLDILTKPDFTGTHISIPLPGGKRYSLRISDGDDTMTWKKDPKTGSWTPGPYASIPKTHFDYESSYMIHPGGSETLLHTWKLILEPRRDTMHEYVEGRHIPRLKEKDIQARRQLLKDLRGNMLYFQYVPWTHTLYFEVVPTSRYHLIAYYRQDLMRYSSA